MAVPCLRAAPRGDQRKRIPGDPGRAQGGKRMTGDAQLSLQAAIFSALSAYAPLTALGVQVFDSVPAQTAFPYVQIGDATVVDWDSQTFDGQNSTLTIHS